MFSHKIYFRKVRKTRRELALKILGRKCNRCGSKKKLHVDHINPKTKKFELAEFAYLNIKKWIKELRKCQLLCIYCHGKKTALDNGLKLAEGTHGTLSAYRYCKCKVCKKANANYMRKYKKQYSPLA